ncbi:hypothetical protein AYI69_g6803 [Smittium culicis]|uniref:Core-binding (CB) domain-containing protein n=1 Tax=Smittium culicis TaxID=133412 RepID=A0A1R1XWL4_9FUNG|nr:hypothetical protein AYI69_g6803 [Smittium culicis]
MNLADAPSRLTAQTEWSLSDEAYEKISFLYGKNDVDLLASRANRKVGTYYSWFPDNKSVGQNSLAHSWSGWSNPYGCPPWNLIGQAIRNHMVPGSSMHVGRATTSYTSDNGDTRSRKRKISALQQQGVVLDGLEDQRSILKAQGLTDNAINIIVSNQRSAKRRSRYYTTQIKFLEWHIDNADGSPIQASHIINYLAEIFISKKLCVNTIKAYKSAITSLVEDSEEIDS